MIELLMISPSLTPTVAVPRGCTGWEWVRIVPVDATLQSTQGSPWERLTVPNPHAKST